MSTFPVQAYRKVLVVVKQTAFQMYRQLKARGQAPLALRWERLENRDAVHRRCVQDVLRLLHSNSCTTNVIGREELHHQHLSDHDLLVAVGGDGTALSASHFLLGNVPLLAINSDPDIPPTDSKEKRKSAAGDTVRSVGALCACSSLNMSNVLPQVLFGELLPRPRSRLLLKVSSTYNQTTLPPALNDLLIAHPSPAAMSRFTVTGVVGDAPPDAVLDKNGLVAGDEFKMDSRSSGMWISTATGSTGAMAAAGGVKMHADSGSLQWRIRDESPRPPSAPERVLVTSGFVNKGDSLNVRWNSHMGVAYVDGHFVCFDLELGDKLSISAEGAPLLLF